jgi:hypothetical protein
MYAVIRKYQFNPSAGAEIAKKIQDGFVPVLRKTPGFVAYYWLESADGQGSSLGVFESEAGADESVRIAADFVRDNLAALLGKPEVTKGEVKAHS